MRTFAWTAVLPPVQCSLMSQSSPMLSRINSILHEYNVPESTVSIRHAKHIVQQKQIHLLVWHILLCHKSWLYMTEISKKNSQIVRKQIQNKSNETDAYSGRHSSPLCSQEVMLFRLMRGPEGIETASTWEGGRAWEQERHVPFQKLRLFMHLL